MKEQIVILDTNVYGELLIEEKDEELIDKIRTDKKNLIYGVDVIEKELEKTLIEIKYKGKELRRLLIDLFESLSDEIINITPLAKHLAEEYFERYKKISKSRKYNIKKEKSEDQSLRIDFQIIAIASIHSIDIVVSADTRTMLSQISKDIFKYVNKINQLRTPEFLIYKEFKKKVFKMITLIRRSATMISNKLSDRFYKKRIFLSFSYSFHQIFEIWFFAFHNNQNLNGVYKIFERGEFLLQRIEKQPV